MVRLIRKIETWAAAGFLLGATVFRDACAEDSPEKTAFEQVISLVRSNAPGIAENEIYRAAISGVAKQFSPQILLAPKAEGTTNESGILKTTVFDAAFGYVRVGGIDKKSVEGAVEAIESMQRNGRIKGILFDLRYAGGFDYQAAAALTDRFLSNAQPLLKVEGLVIASTAKTNAWRIPVAAVINQETTGSAEAFAGLVRQSEVGLLIGSRTAGRASSYQEFSLQTGEKLRIGNSPVQFGDGSAVSDGGLVPDIVVQVPLEEEKAYYDDPFKEMRKGAQAASPARANPGISTNRFSRRGLNEAELVRRHREGVPLDEGGAAAGSDQPQMNDPALARALDFLKGVSVAARLRRL